ncbi:DNA topoisomerase I [Limimonas halophila]|uniref:DNA topoisomerase 1 n=1 Tax=Limimonas halophila TaxID=1082479 RepID=A0A1G7P8K3_9PROT|nr:type I DNA topoisomerase [Limimonas halophila]SDF81770.1 DNA topoisomerase I [Limimonas halophila]
MNVVVVESPAKAKTINKYLGDAYTVLASYGHVRDLPSKDGSVRPDEDFAMEWEVDSKADKRIKEIAQAVKQADALYLATDPDREGEAISWHILEELRRRRALKGVDVKRVAFNAITKDAIQSAFREPRDLNQELIDAYLARRALDYLVGFTLSPVLWRKLPGSKSAGRVQSVALRLICEREAEIEAFRPQEYWSITASLLNTAEEPFTARLTHLDGEKLGKFALPDETSATRAKERLEAASRFAVESIERKQTRRNPQAPFATSTLQQEASRKLGFSATRTMRVAQRLYEGVDIGGTTVGLITYMRTDGVQMAQEALDSTRELIGARFGGDYLPAKARQYATKAKNAQEAHEAIRPTDLFRTPEDIGGYLDDEGRKLYELVWTRTVASQMTSAVFNQVTAEIAVDDRMATLRATGQTLAFAGFLKLYREGRDDDSESDETKRLPELSEGERVAREAITPEQHWTQPPPRYTEATLVRKLEELGIGRPSTYAQILQVLQDRDYVRLEKKRFVPEDRGRLVTAFLTSFFDRYVEYDFTAKLEDQLDEISGGRADWKQVLRDFWQQFHEEVERTKGLRMADVVEALDAELGPHFFQPDPENPDADPRECPRCGGRLGLKIGKMGGFIGCANYPDCTYTRPLIASQAGDAAASTDNGPRELGKHPESGDAVTLRTGPYGMYIQEGEAQNGQKPRRVSLPKGYDPASLDLHTAVELLRLPRTITQHPEDGNDVVAGIGRYGPYVRHNRTYVSLTADDDVLTIGENRAMALLAEGNKKGKRASNQTVLGEHPSDGKQITAGSGRYGPYVKHGRTFASLPEGESLETITLDKAVELVNAQAEKKGTKSGGKKASSGGTAKSGAKQSKSSGGNAKKSGSKKAAPAADDGGASSQG